MRASRVWFNGERGSKLRDRLSRAFGISRNRNAEIVVRQRVIFRHGHGTTTIAPTEPTGRRPATRRISTAGADLPTFTIGNVAAGLNTDWHHLCADAGVDHRVEVWPAPFGGPGASLEHTLALCGGDRTIDLDVADAHLATLVALAGHDDLAARVVL